MPGATRFKLEDQDLEQASEVYYHTEQVNDRARRPSASLRCLLTRMCKFSSLSRSRIMIFAEIWGHGLYDS